MKKNTLKSHLAADPMIWRILALSLSKRLFYVLLAYTSVIAFRWFQGREDFLNVGPDFLVTLAVFTLFWLSSVWRTFETSLSEEIKNEETKEN